MAKIYTSYKQLAFSIYPGGCRQWIEFTQCRDNKNQYQFVANGEITQNAIEKSVFYRQGFIRCDKTADEEPYSLMQVTDIKTVDEAMTFLKRNGYSGPHPKSKAAINKVAEGMGFNLVGFISK